MNGITPEATADAIERCATLTPAERNVLILSAKGLNSKEVGAIICRAHKTVERVKTAIFEKLDVSSTVEAAVIAAKAGIV
jgi:DNA-binding NarL/FixJ family response regulator